MAQHAKTADNRMYSGGSYTDPNPNHDPTCDFDCCQMWTANLPPCVPHLIQKAQEGKFNAFRAIAASACGSHGRDFLSQLRASVPARTPAPPMPMYAARTPMRPQQMQTPIPGRTPMPLPHQHQMNTSMPGQIPIPPAQAYSQMQMQMPMPTPAPMPPYQYQQYQQYAQTQVFYQNHTYPPSFHHQYPSPSPSAYPPSTPRPPLPRPPAPTTAMPWTNGHGRFDYGTKQMPATASTAGNANSSICECGLPAQDCVPPPPTQTRCSNRCGTLSQPQAAPGPTAPTPYPQGYGQEFANYEQALAFSRPPSQAMSPMPPPTTASYPQRQTVPQMVPPPSTKYYSQGQTAPPIPPPTATNYHQGRLMAPKPPVITTNYPQEQPAQPVSAPNASMAPLRPGLLDDPRPPATVITAARQRKQRAPRPIVRAQQIVDVFEALITGGHPAQPRIIPFFDTARSSSEIIPVPPPAYSAPSTQTNGHGMQMQTGNPRPLGPKAPAPVNATASIIFPSFPAMQRKQPKKPMLIHATEIIRNGPNGYLDPPRPMTASPKLVIDESAASRRSTPSPESLPSILDPRDFQLRIEELSPVPSQVPFFVQEVVSKKSAKKAKKRAAKAQKSVRNAKASEAAVAAAVERLSSNPKSKPKPKPTLAERAGDIQRRECSLCQRAFVSNDALKKHMRLVHFKPDLRYHATTWSPPKTPLTPPPVFVGQGGRSLLVKPQVRRPSPSLALQFPIITPQFLRLIPSIPIPRSPSPSFTSPVKRFRESCPIQAKRREPAAASAQGPPAPSVSSPEAQSTETETATPVAAAPAETQRLPQSSLRPASPSMSVPTPTTTRAPAPPSPPVSRATSDLETTPEQRVSYPAPIYEPISPCSMPSSPVNIELPLPVEVGLEEALASSSDNLGHGLPSPALVSLLLEKHQSQFQQLQQQWLETVSQALLTWQSLPPARGDPVLIQVSETSPVPAAMGLCIREPEPPASESPDDPTDERAPSPPTSEPVVAIEEEKRSLSLVPGEPPKEPPPVENETQKSLTPTPDEARPDEPEQPPQPSPSPPPRSLSIILIDIADSPPEMPPTPPSSSISSPPSCPHSPRAQSLAPAPLPKPANQSDSYHVKKSKKQKAVPAVPVLIAPGPAPILTPAKAPEAAATVVTPVTIKLIPCPFCGFLCIDDKHKIAHIEEEHVESQILFCPTCCNISLGPVKLKEHLAAGCPGRKPSA